MAAPNIRRGAPEDIEACIDLHLRARAAWRFLPREPHTRDETRAWMRHVVFATRRVWVAETEGRVAGTKLAQNRGGPRSYRSPHIDEIK